MSEYAIELDKICKSYPHFALQDLSLQLPKGCIMGFIGPNGAGKSTTIRILMGLVHQDSGYAKVLGQSMPDQQVAAKWDIGFASEDMRLYKNATIDWHMNYMEKIYPSWDSDYADKLIRRFDLKSRQEIKGLSHGQRVKAGLLMCLARKPKLLVLDEPTTGLDPVARHEVINELMDVVLDEERSILFSSHNTQDIEQLSDLITFVDRGKVIDCQDKESYLEKWRRLRLQVESDTILPSLQGVVEQRRAGHQAIITTKCFDKDMAQTYENNGAQIQAVENMTLEEIFISEVQSSRIEVTA